MSPTAKELLERAATYIATHGLAKGQLGIKGGPCCMLGALSLASGVRDRPTEIAHPEPSEFEALLALTQEVDMRRYGHALAPFSREGIAAWNDADRRTKEDAIEAFEAAAKRLP